MSIVLDKNSIRFLPYLLLVLLAMVLYWEMAAGLLQSWQDREEFSHGYFLPVIWQKRDEILALDRLGPSWLGVAICIVALLLYLIGSIGLTPYVQRISILVLIYGVFIAALGFRVTPFLLIPLTLIFMSFPLPVLVNSALTAKMQLISSELGHDDSAVRYTGFPGRQCHRHWRYEVAGRRGLQRFEVHVSVTQPVSDTGLFVQSRDVEAGVDLHFSNTRHDCDEQFSYWNDRRAGRILRCANGNRVPA